MTGRHGSPPNLRGHHFICLQFYRGEGYSPAFVENLTGVVSRAAENDAIVVVGADDVCSACSGLAPDRTCTDPSGGEAEVRRLDRLAEQLLDLSPGDRLSLRDARERLSADAVGVGRWRALACAGCAWEPVCQEGWDGFLGEG